MFSLFQSKKKMDPPKDDFILGLNGLLKKHNAILSGDRLLQLYSKKKEGWINEMNIIVQLDQAKNLINEICNEKEFILTSVFLPCRKYSDTDVMYFTIQKKYIKLIYDWNGPYDDELGSSNDWIIPALPEIPAGQQLDFIKVDNNGDWIIVKYENKEYVVPKNYTDFINIFIHVTMHRKVEKVISTYPFSFTQIWYDGVNTYSNFKQDIEKEKGSLIISKSKRCDENYINNKLIYYSPFFKINNNQIKINNTQNISLPELPGYLLEMYDFFDSFFNRIIDIFEPSLLLENIELFKLYKVYEDINIICHFDNIIKFIQKYSNLSTIQKVVLEFAKNSYEKIFSPYDWANIRDFFNPYYDKLLNTLYLIAYLEVEEKTTYPIYLTADFVLKTQYRPRNIEDFVGEYEHYQKLINDKSIRVIYSCPKGHLHDAIGCGIPVNISTCDTFDNGEQCKCLIGGLKHMLVPGNYIVYHAGSPTAQNANINYGWFPIESYKTYESILNQANDAIDKYNNSNEIKKLEKITRQYDKPIIQTARWFNKDSDSFEITPDSNCPICSDELDVNDITLYILPCRHLIHEDCLLLARGGDLNNLDDVDGIRKCGACNQHFNFGLRLRSSHASKRDRRRSIRRSRIQNKARSGRRNAPRLTKSHNKRKNYCP